MFVDGYAIDRMYSTYYIKDQLNEKYKNYDSFSSVSVMPGKKQQGTLIYELDDDWEKLEIYVNFSQWSFKAKDRKFKLIYTR